MQRIRIAVFTIAFLSTALSSFAQSAPPPSAPSNEAQLLKSAESFVRNLFAWGPEFKVELGPPAPSFSPVFYKVPLRVTVNGQTDAGLVYISKDGKTFFRGEMFDTSADPYAENRSKIHADGNPFRGPAGARVTVVEFSDFQCPHCRELFEQLKTIEPQFPQVRFVFKDFPLTQLHPWADTAAIGARCAFLQSPDAFWKVHDAIFNNQDLISSENIWNKLLDYAGIAGLDTPVFKACMASPEAKQAVETNRTDGIALGVNSTPTVFVNGRPVVGGDPAMIQQFIAFELSAHSK